jgi:phage head maturation protease
MTEIEDMILETINKIARISDVSIVVNPAMNQHQVPCISEAKMNMMRI